MPHRERWKVTSGFQPLADNLIPLSWGVRKWRSSATANPTRGEDGPKGHFAGETNPYGELLPFAHQVFLDTLLDANQRGIGGETLLFWGRDT